MKHELIERTAREWVEGNTHRLPRLLARSALTEMLEAAHSPEEITEALVQLAGRLEIAETRVW